MKISGLYLENAQVWNKWSTKMKENGKPRFRQNNSICMHVRVRVRVCMLVYVCA